METEERLTLVDMVMESLRSIVRLWWSLSQWGQQLCEYEQMALE